MKNKKVNDKVRKAVVGIALPLGIITALVITSIVYTDIEPRDMIVDLTGNNEQPTEEESWHTVYVWTPTGENDPGASTGGFLSCFLLDYGEDPATVLANNATDWSASATVHAYADSDDWSEDTLSEDPFYVVVRARFTATQAKDGAAWNGSRTRVTLTASGDESISQTVVGNNTAETYGGGIESDNNSDYTYLYMNFYFDDNSDGYVISDDGSLTISSIVIDAKY